MANTLIVVSGGDAPGINMAIAHYVRTAAEQGDIVYGADGGFPGLLANQVRPLTTAKVLPWAGIAGSLLSSSRDPVLSQPEAASQITAVLQSHAIDTVLLFGGNGTMRHVLPLLFHWSVRCVGVPTTIDNDVPGTEMTLGFDSACNYACSTIDGIHATAHGLPGRMFMVETLGGSCGNLALAVAESADAHAVIVPEYEYNEIWLADRLRKAVEREGYALLVIGEFARGARTLADTLPATVGIRMRDVRLGHAQRGSAPSHRDRRLGVQMAQAAYIALRQGISTGVTVVQGGRVQIHEGLLPATESPPPDRAAYERINGLAVPSRPTD